MTKYVAMKGDKYISFTSNLTYDPNYAMVYDLFAEYLVKIDPEVKLIPATDYQIKKCDEYFLSCVAAITENPSPFRKDDGKD